MLRDQPFMRDDTFLGVCEALGEDFRIPANLLRIALAPLLIWNPVLVFSAYVMAGVLIALLRWIVPNPSGDRVALPAATEEARSAPAALPEMEEFAAAA